MVQAASTRLNKQAEYVNSLNVFPVPDGDTGTNMGMTIENGAKEVADKPASTVGEVASILAKGLLMGARGNSGVITSQLFRGFSQAIKDKDELTDKIGYTTWKVTGQIMFSILVITSFVDSFIPFLQNIESKNLLMLTWFVFALILWITSIYYSKHPDKIWL